MLPAPKADHVAERADGVGSDRVAEGHRGAGVAQAVLPGDGFEPVLLGHGIGCAFVLGAGLLTPITLEAQPRERVNRVLDGVREQNGGEGRALDRGGRVVTPDAFAVGAKTHEYTRREVVGVRARGDEDEGPVPLAVELGVGPTCLFAGTVLRQRYRLRWLLESPLGGRGVEGELDELPVCLVIVVPVVEVIEQPVLEDDGVVLFDDPRVSNVR